MANSRRTYQWVDGRVQEYRQPPRTTKLIESADRPRPFMTDSTARREKMPALGVQDALLLFTLSSLGLVFAGGALFAFCFVTYALIFG
jgi:hypothetical protein